MFECHKPARSDKMINMTGMRLCGITPQQKLLAAEVAIVGRKPPFWTVGEIFIEGLSLRSDVVQ